MTEKKPRPCPNCLGRAGQDCRTCNGVGYERYVPPTGPPPGTSLFHPSVIPDVVPPKK